MSVNATTSSTSEDADAQDAASGGPHAAASDSDSAAAAEQAGLAHVATASFLTSRVVPTGGFAVALTGGMALARAAQIAGLRAGYGASIAATLQAVAVMGPSRFGVPLTQGLSAPLIGRLYARGAALATQFAACIAIRTLSHVVTASFYIWIIAGGIDAYSATYDALLGAIPGVPDGPSAALTATVIGLVLWTAFASVVQVLVYRAALRAWPATPATPVRGGASPQRPAPSRASEPPQRSAGSRAAPSRASEPPQRSAGSRAAPSRASEPSQGAAPSWVDTPARRYDPRAVALAAIVAFCLLVATTAWALLAPVAVWLAVAWATARGDRAPVRAGLALTAVLAGGALAFGLIGGVDLDLTLQRTVRAALLVLVATWLRAAAGEEGLREVARRSLGRARRLPAALEAAPILACLGADGSLTASGRALVEELRHVSRRPPALAAAVLRWAAAESARFTPPPAAAAADLRTRARDWALVAGVIAAGALAAWAVGRAL